MFNMKKIIFCSVVLLLMGIIITTSSFKAFHRNEKHPSTCTNVKPHHVHATVSGGYVTVTWDAQGAGTYFTVGGYYQSGMQIPYSCPATSGYTFPYCGDGSCGGTLRVTSWCGSSCATGTNGKVSDPVTF